MRDGFRGSEGVGLLRVLVLVLGLLLLFLILRLKGLVSRLRVWVWVLLLLRVTVVDGMTLWILVGKVSSFAFSFFLFLSLLFLLSSNAVSAEGFEGRLLCSPFDGLCW